MKTNIGFNQQREEDEQDGSEWVLGASASIKGLSDSVAGLVGAVYAWGNPINGIYQKVSYSFNHAIDIIKRISIPYLPEGNIQRGREDWMSCASNAPNNELEKQHNYALTKGLFSPELVQWFKDNGYINNGQFEVSDAWVSIGSGTTKNGNSLKSPLDFIRHNGLIPRSLLPDDKSMTFDEYHNPNRITQKMRTIGQEYMKRMSINYQKVYRADFISVIEKIKWEIMDSYRA